MEHSDSALRRRPLAREATGNATPALSTRATSARIEQLHHIKPSKATNIAPGLPARAPLARMNVNARTLPLVVAAIEFMLVAIATFEAGALYHKLAFDRFPFATFYLLAALFLAGLFVVPCGFARDYSLKRLLDPKEQLRSLLLHWNYAYSLFVFALFMIHATDFYPRGAIIVQYATGLATATLVRLLLTAAVARGLHTGHLEGKKVAVIGDAGLIDETVRRLHLDGQGVDVVAAVPLRDLPSAAYDRSGADLAARTRAEAQNVVRNMERIAQHVRLDDIVISLSWSESERIQALTDGLAAIPATIHLAPDRASAWTRDPATARIGHMRTIRLSRAPLTLRDRILKRAFDVTAALLLLTLFAPLFVAIALLIKLDSPGPVLFRQRRHGFNHHEFRVFKFRTMKTLDDGTTIQQATRNDARITRVGRFLRSTNLDELPQLFNVVADQMSLVGPRPHAIAHNNEYEEKIRLYACRHKVKPGITGWAQVNGHRGETDSIEKMHRRVDHDLFYIHHWSLMFDIKILVMTVLSPRSYRNAY